LLHYLTNDKGPYSLEEFSLDDIMNFIVEISKCFNKSNNIFKSDIIIK